MLTHEKTEFTFGAGEDSIIQRLLAFLGHYELRVYVSSKGYVDVGCGSFEAALRMHAVADDFDGCLGTIGAHANVAQAKLMGGGEHWNEYPVNTIFSNITLLAVPSRANPTLCPKPKKPFTIGNGVVISDGAVVLQGATLGDGVVLGANSVASGVLEPFGIYGGVPAKLIKKRFDLATQEATQAVRWWDFDIPYLSEHIEDMQKVAVDRHAQHVYRKPQPRLVMKVLRSAGEKFTVEITSFIENGTQRPISEAPQKVKDYLGHMGASSGHYWLADMWS